MQRIQNMHRMKNTGAPLPRQPGSLLAGMMIGSTIMALAAQAMALGANAAIQDAFAKQR